MRSSNPSHRCENEFTGGIFGEDGKTFFITQQHQEDPTFRMKIG